MATKITVISPPEAGPDPDQNAKQFSAPAANSRLRNYLEWGWMAGLMVLFALHAVHLRADFPNYSPWMDYAKYTDEGWYGNAAIEAFLRGSWYMPGDFNTAVALPVWPFLLWLLFHVTGVSLAAARALAVAVFGGNLLLTYGLVRTGQVINAQGAMNRDVLGAQGFDLRTEPAPRRWPALLAATLVASSAFLYCFGRLAILEPLVIFFLLLSWLLALRLRVPAAATEEPSGRAGEPNGRGGPTLRLILIGVVVCLMVLTKTTAVVLLPSLYYVVWNIYSRETPGGSSRLAGERTGARIWERIRERVAKRIRERTKACAIVTAAALVPWSAYYFLLVRPHYLADYRYLFTANVYQQPASAGGWIMAFWYALHGAVWIDGILFVLGAALLVLSGLLMSERRPSDHSLSGLGPSDRGPSNFGSTVHAVPNHSVPGTLAGKFPMRALWRDPLYVAAFLAIVFQIAFVGYHNNMQPRYYMVAAYPLFILIALSVESLLLHQRLLGRLALALIAVAVAVNTLQTIRYVRQPQYTFANAAENLTRYIDQHPNGNRLLLSISGNEIGLVTGLPAICDDFGTLDLPARIRQYQPGWYAAWNELDPGTLEDIHTQFRLEEVARYPAFDDEDRNVLILYKLHPLPLARQRIGGGDDDHGEHAYDEHTGAAPRNNQARP